MMKGIGHLALLVKDMDKALDFYTRVLGGKYAFSFDQDGKPWIEYVQLVPGQFVELFYNRKAENAGSFMHICLSVEDIDAACKQIMDAGYPVDRMPSMGCDGNMQAWVTDPDGNSIELMQLMPGCPQLKEY